jgi:penicillin amidase
MALLEDLQVTDPEAELALTLLRQWDGNLMPESIGATVFQVLVRQLAPDVLTNKLAPTLLPALLGQGMSDILHPVNEFQGYLLVNLLKILAKVPSPWFDSLATRNKLIERCLVEATAFLRQKLGENPAEWQWGHLHPITFKHPVGLISPFDRVFNVGPFPVGGDGNTVSQAGMRPNSFASDAISVSSRFIIDLSAIEQAEAMLAPGQSGHLGSPHYQDLAPMWLKGENFTILWTHEAIAAATQHTLVLTKRP